MARKEPAITVSLPHQMRGPLEQLLRTGRYGLTLDAVSSYLIQREIDDLFRAGVVSAGAPPQSPKQ